MQPRAVPRDLVTTQIMLPRARSGLGAPVTSSPFLGQEGPGAVLTRRSQPGARVVGSPVAEEPRGKCWLPSQHRLAQTSAFRPLKTGKYFSGEKGVRVTSASMRLWAGALSLGPVSSMA